MYRGLAPTLALRQRLGVHAKAEQISGLAHQPIFPESGNLLLAQTLDIESVAADKMPQALDRLGRTDQPTGAAAYRFSRLTHSARVADRTGLGHHKRHRPLGTLLEYHFDHLRNHIACALDDNRIADADALLRNQLFIMQAGARDHHAADRDGRQIGNRRQGTRAPDLDGDTFESGGGTLGRKLVRDGPARATADPAEAFLPVEPVDLVNNAINIIVEIGAAIDDPLIVAEHGSEIGAARCPSVELETEATQTVAGLPQGVAKRITDLAPGIGRKAEPPRCGNRRIDLAQAARGTVARIGVERLLRRLTCVVENGEIRLRHVDLATHFQDGRRITL